MEWVDRMNGVIDYIEDHLCGELDTEEISRIMACPYSVFQRSFGPVTGMQLSEYIRRRKLTCAAYELRNTDQRVLDIAVKYGYDSADAFTAAFRRLHGVTPAEARRTEVSLKFCTRLTFTLMIMGVHEMNYKVIEKKSFDVLGVRRTTPYGGGTWGIVKSDGTAEKLKALGGHPCDLGLCFGFDGEGNNDYMCGVEFTGDVPGFDAYRYPDVTFLVFTAEGKITDGVLGETWKRVYGEFIPQSAYKQLDLPTIERYVTWDEADDNCKVEILIPVSK
jgi:AraC family transcriptional regulator